jgi:hypothetical protein
MNSWVDLHALWQIVVIGLLAGAGLPAVFAFGLRALALDGRHDTTAVRAVPAGGSGSDQVASGDAGLLAGASALGIAVATVCFAIVLAAIGYGIYLIVAGT